MTNRPTNVATASTSRAATAIRNFSGRHHFARSRPSLQRDAPGAIRMAGAVDADAAAAADDDDDAEPYPSSAELFDHHSPHYYTFITN